MLVPRDGKCPCYLRVLLLNLLVDRWSGKDPEPRPGLSSGHIPNSLSVPFSSFLMKRTYTPAGKRDPITFTELASPSALQETLESLVGKEYADQIRSGKRGVIASCGSGMTAGVVWLSLQLMGVKNIGLYDEASFSQTPSTILK
jgi:thiosulfate/3-mercaptopyruvate sulfurtransferase